MEIESHHIDDGVSLGAGVQSHKLESPDDGKRLLLGWEMQWGEL